MVFGVIFEHHNPKQLTIRRNHERTDNAENAGAA
jgi:hypothetical protein